MINVVLRIPDRLKARAGYALDALSTIWGIPVNIVSRKIDFQTVVYGVAEDADKAGLVLPCDLRAYESGREYAVRLLHGALVWAPADAQSSSEWDLIGSTYRLLTFLDEAGVAASSRDRRGVFSTASLPRQRREAADELLVENQAAVLLERLCAAYPRLKEAAAPLWPNGKRCALLLSHDTDAISLGSPAEMAYNLGKAILRRNPMYLRMFWEGVRYFGRPARNPLYGFPRWHAMETPLLRSCFYLYAKPKELPRDLNDCRSSVADRGVDWNSLRRMAEQGWEFGLHAPIHAKDEVNAFRWGKQFLEERLSHPVRGLRHHYWALDWRHPHRTLAKHAAAGFRYDTSIAWRDAAGFRAGTSLPFRPFHPEAEETIDLWEIPASLMDGHLHESGKPVEQQIADGLSLIRKIKRRGGVAMLNWHTEVACDDYQYRGCIPLILSILSAVVEDSDVWLTTPWQLIQHWEQRHASLGARTHAA